MPYVSLQDYVKAARGDGVIALPTDTVWGLAVNPEHSSILYELKRRSPEKSLILLGASAPDLWPYVSDVAMDGDQWQAITDQHWPGQLTLVIPASAQVPLAMHLTTPDTIGVRVPNHPVARQILTLTGPLATTSANLSGQPQLMGVDQVLDQFPQVYGLEICALQELVGASGALASSLPVPSGMPSTVARWQLDHWEILRQGTVYL
ncbi:L-threonylcarbamoyladenylate synthase [Leptothoe sp. PORK10 BA2]|uniref:L-threonylcarbamoyladenylate synthase n=1 Tax=Leptothoe sp. PORK10 BA2 TaxID=3110254 RepID=UPI002B217511|nr:L-threonylcarbamoyladenylate synthase [Leptothoe sp. PORK10 BA2]MEA5464213.1 L-threonylcarbamoyladenylate synthase [Leptothoe sp. PORK10 BA2]